jgi:hypothetical protein
MIIPFYRPLFISDPVEWTERVKQIGADLEKKLGILLVEYEFTNIKYG